MGTSCLDMGTSCSGCNLLIYIFLGQVDTIKAAMTGFELPSKNIPDWAREITEDQWKDRLLSSLKSKKS